MQTVLYGGAFNPPHDGHEAIIRTLANAYESVLVVPSGTRVDKAYSSDSYRVTEEIRARVLRAFECRFQDIPNVRFDYDMLEGKLEKTTTVWMDAYYAEKLGTEITHAFWSDVVRDFPRWHDPEAIRSRIRKILIVRNGEEPNLSGLSRFDLISPKMSDTERWLSSSSIRNALARNDFTGLSPEVAQAIRISFA